jgi:hypothetical protein
VVTINVKALIEGKTNGLIKKLILTFEGCRNPTWTLSSGIDRIT